MRLNILFIIVEFLILLDIKVEPTVKIINKFRVSEPPNFKKHGIASVLSKILENIDSETRNINDSILKEFCIMLLININNTDKRIAIKSIRYLAIIKLLLFIGK